MGPGTVDLVVFFEFLVVFYFFEFIIFIDVK